MVRAGILLISIALYGAAHAQSAQSDQEMGIVTTKGYVKFRLMSDWRILGMQSKPPVSAVSVQIPYQAADGTADSTQFAILLYHIDYEKGKQSLSDIGQQLGASKPSISTIRGWTIYDQIAEKDGKPCCIILDAKKPMADVVVGVRMSWPKGASYDQNMRDKFSYIISNISGGFGKMPSEGADFYRPK